MTSPNTLPNMRFSHMGINVLDMDVMEDFYTRVLGFTITDRGNAIGADLIFLSRDPKDHHQIVLTAGRPKDLPQNVVNPMLGPSISQISFDVGSIKALKKMDAHLKEHLTSEFIYANHGTAWSIYIHDPEGNFLEFFVDSEWYIPQPVFEPLDLSLPEEEILRLTKEMCEQTGKMEPMKDWRADISRKMGVS